MINKEKDFDDFVIVIMTKQEKDLVINEAQKNNESLTRFCSNKILEGLTNN